MNINVKSTQQTVTRGAVVRKGATELRKTTSRKGIRAASKGAKKETTGRKRGREEDRQTRLRAVLSALIPRCHHHSQVADGNNMQL